MKRDRLKEPSLLTPRSQTSSLPSWETINLLFKPLTLWHLAALAPGTNPQGEHLEDKWTPAVPGMSPQLSSLLA